MEAYKIPLMKDQMVQSEIKMVKILTGKYKGKVKPFVHYIVDKRGYRKAVVHVDVCKYACYGENSVEFVDSKYCLVPEFYK